MKKRVPALILALLLLLPLAACGGGRKGLPPDLTGSWAQDPDGAGFYQTATITSDRIYVYWHLVEDDSEHLYWVGTFTPPTTDGTYTWVSENREDEVRTTPWTRHEDTLSFKYQNGSISYTIFMGNLKMGVSLDKETIG